MYKLFEEENCQTEKGSNNKKGKTTGRVENGSGRVSWWNQEQG